jgi:antirestriction protein ArdC
VKADLYQRITAEIIAAIEAGAADYRMPWHTLSRSGAPVNAGSSRPYRGINTLLLWCEAGRRGYSSNRWATYRQWNELGAQVRKSETSTTVLLWKPIAYSVDREDAGDQPARQRLLARAFRVFNADQVDSGDLQPAAHQPTPERITSAEAFFAAQPAAIWHGSDGAFYDRRADMVSMPSFDALVSAEAYYSVLAHELTHWTGAKGRLDRDLSGRFGSDAYAIEELVAELGAAFTVGYLDLACEPRIDHAPYIASWLRVLRDDPRAILSAASKAQAAADYLIELADPKPPGGETARPSAQSELEVAAA